MTTRALVRRGTGPIHIAALSTTGRTWVTDAGYLPVDQVTAVTGPEAVTYADEHEAEFCPTCRDWGLRAAESLHGREVVPTVYRRRIVGWPA